MRNHLCAQCYLLTHFGTKCCFYEFSHEWFLARRCRCYQYRENRQLQQTYCMLPLWQIVKHFKTCTKTNKFTYLIVKQLIFINNRNIFTSFTMPSNETLRACAVVVVFLIYARASILTHHAMTRIDYIN